MSDPFAVLGRIRGDRPAERVLPGECCELCGAGIPEDHGHVVDLAARNLLCACRGCYLLFTPEGAGGGHYRAVPERYQALKGFAISAPHWEALQVPVGVAFFFFNSELGKVTAFYPGPAGATESLLGLDAWSELEAAHPELAGLEPDVEALLVRAEPHRGAVEGFVVPIDACYELVGRLRRLWRGFDGGKEARAAIDEFFAKVRSRSR